MPSMKTSRFHVQEKPANEKITHVYLKSDEHGYIPALQLKAHNKKAVVIVPKYKKEQEILSCGKQQNKQKFHVEQTVNLTEYPNHVLPMQNVDANGNLEDYKDMVELPFLHEAAILYNLKYRHINEKPYTRTGDILIAVNPYKWLDDLYTEEKRAYYSNRLVWDNPEDDPRSQMEPHIYEVSALAYKGLIDNDKDQSILVSGESGAGKTETVKICLNHIASVQRGHTLGYYDENELDPTVKKVVQSNPLLEAFGNAKTRRNDNSSRFGKYLQLQFNKSQRNEFGTRASRSALIGSKCDVYLLEKNRIVTHDRNERTFHIFYQLLASPDTVKTRFWKGLKGTTNQSFSYVGHTDTNTIEGITDANRFVQTVDALKLVGVEGPKLDLLMQAVCVVMQLGNLGFASVNGDNDKSKVSTTAELAALAELMGVNETDLTDSITERTFVTRSETHKVPLSPAMAKDACDALAKEVYQKTFLWLTNAINEATSVESTDKIGTIGLLDIFGFETFEVNRFEQLCINYANEKLQQKFTEDVFTNVKAEYEAEGLELADITYDDNIDVLELIENRNGLLALLNEECVRPKGNDIDYVHKVFSMNKSSPCLILHRTDRLSFGIMHYAGEVMYDADMFVSKNIDTLPTDLQACTEKCTNSIINTPRLDFDHVSVQSSTSPVGRRSQTSNITAATVWTKYRRQLSTLMNSLRQTDSRYIRCIKPNELKAPTILEHNLVIDQLRCAGVVAGITITRSMFPNRLSNYLVLTRFGSMGDSSSNAVRSATTPNERRAAQCDALLKLALQPKETVDDKGRKVKAYVVGKTKTYFRAGALEYLESHRVRSLDTQVITIQKAARGWLVRNSGSRQRQLRRMAELEKARRQEEERERKAQFEQELRDRRERHKLELELCEKQAALLQKQVELAKARAEERIVAARTRVEEVKEDNERMAQELKHKQQELVTARITEKARHEKKLEEQRKIIIFLKRQNKKLQKDYALIGGHFDANAHNSMKLDDSLGYLNGSLSEVGGDKIKVEARMNSLKTIYNETQVLNRELKEEVSKLQDKYMEQAEARLSLQKTMARVLNMIQDRCTDSNIIEDVVILAMETESEAKCILAGAAVTDPNDEEPVNPDSLHFSNSSL